MGNVVGASDITSFRSPKSLTSYSPSPASKRDSAPAIRNMLPAMSKANLRENIYTIPNILTASRLVAAPFIGYCILHDYHAMALGLFAYAGITDALDGWIARRWNLKTVVGTVIDPMADKTLMTVLTVALAMKGALPLWLAVIILGRDVGLAISAIYYRWISLPPPKTFARYWDFSLPSAEVRPTQISKYNTALQLGLMGLTTLAPVIPAVDMSTPLGVLQYVVATTTIWSGASYVYSKDAVKILTPKEVEEKKAEETRAEDKKTDSR
ncbi:CDP-alcohol phosphatidyltransferase-domain-containing protein [Corynascus similis CBS 632.67]